MSLTPPLATAARWLVAIAIFLFLPSANVLLLMSPGFVAHEYIQPGFPAAELYSPQDRLTLAQQTVRAIISPNTRQALEAMRHNGQPVYNEREVQHLVDVVVVLDALRWVWRVAGVIIAAGLILALAQPLWRKPFAQGTFLGGVLVVGALLGILLSALVSFDWFFVRFHQVFFSGDTWLFAYEDSLIQFYPVEFWMDAVWKLGALSLLEGLVVGAASFVYIRRRGAAS